MLSSPLAKAVLAGIAAVVVKRMTGARPKPSGVSWACVEARAGDGLILS